MHGIFDSGAPEITVFSGSKSASTSVACHELTGHGPHGAMKTAALKFVDAEVLENQATAFL